MRVRMTTVYRDWIDGLRDHLARARIQVRVDRLVPAIPARIASSARACRN
jgi:putative component of toxin-antitoxin plasmid stabilization module